MALNIFHGLYDGNCLNRLLDQVSKSYLGEEHLDLGPKFHSILPYGPLTEADGAEHFWTSRISESPAMPLTVSGLESEIAIELNLASKFDACRRALNVTHQAILQAAWVATLMEQSSDGVVSTGIVVSGRAINVDGADKVIGPMFNTIPFCTNSTMVTTWKSLVKLCHDFIVQSLPFQHTPLRAIQKWIRSDPKVGLFDSLFLFQIADKKGDAAFNNQLWTSQPQKNTPDYPLTLDVEYERDGPLRLLLISRGSKLNGVKLDKLMERLETALMQILNDADSRTPLAETNSIASAGDSGPKPHFEANGHGFNGFIWTAPAIAIRKEISRLSQVEENEITEHLSIFELGLDSIDAIKLSSRLTAKGFRLPVSTIMRTATIGSMLHALNAEEDDSPTPGQSLKRLQHVLERYFEKNQDVSLHHAERILPTTPLQDAMIRGMIESDYWQYFNHDVLRLRKDVDEINLRTAWQTVFESTPILRTSFHTVDDPSIRSAYAQVVSQDCAFPWHSTRINDIGSVPKVIEGLRNSARNASSKDTLFQLTMVYDDCGDRYLILSMPHALYDGYSLDLLHQFVREAYEVRDFQKQPSWDATLGKIIEAQESHATIQFWSRHLSKATTCLVKANNDQGHEQLERPAVHRQELAAAMSVSEIRAFCKKQGITPQTLGQCAFAMALATYVHRLDPVFGVVLSGRDTEEAQRLIFPTMNTIAFRCKIDGTKSHFLRATQEIMAGVRAHQHFPLHRAQRLAASTNQMLFNTLFIFQSRANSSDQSEALYKSVDSSSDVDLPICVEMGLEAETVILRTACHGDLFDKEETGELLRRVQLAIQHLTDESTEAIIARSGREVLIGNLPAFVVEESSPRKNGYDNGNAMEVEELPTTPDTEIVLEVVAQVAQVAKDEISPSTTLYHLGLDSISAIKVCSRLKKRGILISVSNLLRAENVEAIAKAVVHSKPSDSNGTLGEIHESAFEEISEVVHSAQEHRAVVGIPDDLVEASLPTTAGQIYMLKHWVQSRGSLFFDTFYFIVAPSSTSIQHLQRAVTKWIENGSMLRTTFTQTSNKDMPFVQHIIKAENVEVVHESIPFGAKPNSGHVRSGRFMTKTKMRSGPQNEFENLFAVSVTYETSKTQSWKLGVRIHHALYDGVSLPALLSDLESLILASSSSSSSSSSSKQKGTRAFSDYTTDSFVSAHDRSARSFWTAYLTALQPTSTGHELNQRGAHSKRLSQYRPQFIGSAEGILQLTKKCGVTLPALFLAVVAQVLAAIKSNASDGQGRSTTIVIGVYIANRGHTSEYLAMYPAVNLLPVVVDTSLPLLKSAAKVQKDLVEISDPAHVSVSLSQILDWTDVKVDTFVNWLQLPDHDDRANYQTDRFRIQGAIDQVIENTAESFTLPKSFTSDHLAAAYPVRSLLNPRTTIEAPLTYCF
jgi:aryl carrier-like protein